MLKRRQNEVKRNIFLFDEVKKKHSRKKSGGDSKRRQNFTNKTVIAAETITFCIKPLTHYLPRSDLKIGGTQTTHQEKQNATKFYITENV